MTASTEVREIINFLKQRFIVTSLEWVEACIAFIKQEQGQSISMNVLKELVYQQWLIADLEEIGVAALSRELATTQKTTLNGSFALQVNGVRDVGKSAYTQLKEFDRNRSSNDEFSAAPEPTVAPWEAKPTRMLMLNLTDGCTSVQGMEYRPIGFLSVNLPPGLKVLVQGPVDCRFGVLLLTADKVKVLGGEVESKFNQYSQKAILQTILHIPTDEESQEDNTSSGTQTNSDDLNSDSVSIISGSSNSRQTTITSAFGNAQYSNRAVNDVRYSNDLQSTNNSRSSSRVGYQVISSHLPATSNAHQGRMGNGGEEFEDLDDFENDDDFVQSLDYEAIDELEKENSLTQVEENLEEENIWNEDEDVLREAMEFEGESPVFEFPDEISDSSERQVKPSGTEKKLPFTYLCTALVNQSSEHTVTVKGFIIRVLSKLECTVDKGWSLYVKINDGSATLDANVHDKVLENIIGISAVEMVQMQKEAVQDMEKRKKVVEAISKCKTTLQDYNCLMDIKFSNDSKPCIIQCHPVTCLEIRQLLERTRSYFL